MPAYLEDDYTIPEPLKIPSFPSNPYLISIEGLDGVGKTSVCRALGALSNIRFQTMHKEFNEFNIKKRMIFEASWMASACFFLSGVMETKREIVSRAGHPVVIMDRSFWSTLAVNWVKDPARIDPILKLYEQMAAFLPIPNKIVVLLADYDECRRRIESKQDKGKELDKVSKEEYLREVEFYYWLSNRLANIEILDTNELALADVTKKIARLLPHGAD